DRLSHCKTIRLGPLEHEQPAVSQTERNKVAPDPLTRARSHFRKPQAIGPGGVGWGLWFLLQLQGQGQ
ncbi:hypothetical protein KUCAC02_009937, partial [Chaenocephalus aceratus]